MMDGLLSMLEKPAVQGLIATALGTAASAGRGRGLLGNLGQGGLMGLQAYTGATDRQVALTERQKMAQYRDAQMQNLQSEMDQRKRKQALIDSLLGGSASPALPGQLGSGSFGAVAPAAGVPDVPVNQPRIPNLSIDQLAALKMHNIDLTDIHKYANEPLKLESGSTYQNRMTGKREYMPRMPEGMSMNGGRAGFVPGFQESVVGLEGAKSRATESAKASFDPVQVAAPDGSMRFVPRSQVVAPQPAAAGNADADRYAILTQELAKARATNNVRDVAALEAEIGRLSPTARSAPSPSGLAVADGGFQATPTTAQAAAAAAAKTRAEADARAASDRDTSRTKKSDSASEMLSNIQRARTLLQMDPTGSMVGAGVDKLLGVAGVSTKSGNIANSLEALAGWLTNSAPRMEGPQSNIDQENYKTMAGRVGDRTLPVAARLAALDEVDRIQQRYAPQNAGGGTSSAPKANVVNELPKMAAKGTRARDTATGKVMVFNGMSWVPEK
jgi:hypothetical protein